ncbi:MAG: ATP-binding protein [Acidimicrobiales bacterium]|nr:ATP-binding protein [Acidimicrobiales bacterium]
MAGTSPFVGRGQELDRLGRLELGTGQCRGVLLVGEAGVGKTRLLEEHLGRAASNGAGTRLVAATGSSTAVPLGCLADLLAPRLAGGVPPDSLFHEAVAALLSDATAHDRWLLAVDDLPKLDDQSAAALHQVLVTTGSSFVATARTGEELPAAFDALWRAGSMELVTVGVLADRDIATLVRSEVDGAVEGDAHHRLVQLAAGNPLALRELMASARETGSLQRQEGRWVLRDGFQTGLQVTALVDQRLAKVDPTLRHALELVAMAEPLPLEVLWQLVDPATTDELVERSFASLDASATALRCGHPLVAEVLRTQLPPGRRRRLSAQLLSALPSDPHGPLLLRRARLVLDAGETAELGLLADAAKAARHVGDRPLAGRLTAAVLDAARADDETRPAAASAALTDALLRFEGGSSPVEVFPAALGWARTDEELLAVITEWTWATLFTQGPQAAEQVIAEQTANLRNRIARLWAEATAATVVGYAGRWATARERASAIAEELRPDDPVRLQLTVRTLLAMAGGFDGSGETALTNGEAAQQLFEWQPVIPITQAICGIVGRLYGVAQLRGFDVMAGQARELTQRSLTGDAYADYAGVFPGVVGNNAVSFAVLTSRTRDEAEEAVRLLRWRDPCGVLSLSVGARGLFAALCGDLSVAEELLDGYDDEFRRTETKTTVLADRGRAWLAYQRGDRTAAFEWAEEAWAASWVRADVAAWAAPAAHDLARFGRPELAIDRLRATAGRLCTPLGDALLAHAEALAKADSIAIEAAAAALEGAGATGLCGEALLHAAAVAAGDRAAALQRRAARTLEGSLLDSPVVRTMRAAMAGPISPQGGTSLTIARAGRGWLLDDGTARVTVRGLAGFGYLATLVSNPDTDVRAATLVNGVHLERPSAQPVLDDEARRTLQARGRAIIDELARARRRGAQHDIARLEDEAEAIATALTQASGAQGRHRGFVDHDERARTSVQKAIRRAIDELADAQPALAAHLAERVTTGVTCRYSSTASR